MSRLNRLPLALLVAATLALLAACAGTSESGRPAGAEWVDDPYVGVDSRRFMAEAGSARGIGRDAQDAARNDALRRLNESLLVHVSSDLTNISEEFAGSDGEERWSKRYLEEIRLQSEGDLPGARDTDRWVDAAANTTWVRVTVERELLVNQWLDPAREARLSAEAQLEGLADAAPDPVNALSLRLSAYDQVASHFTPVLKANAAARAGSDKGGSPLLNEARFEYDAHTSFLSRVAEQVALQASLIRVEALNGDGQVGDPRQPLVEPLVGRVTMEVEGEQRPLAGLPVRFRADFPGARRLPGLSPSGDVTDADGRVWCEVDDLVAGVDGQGIVYLEVGVESLGGSRLSESLRPARFLYSVRRSNQTGVAVGIDTVSGETRLTAADSNPFVADHLAAAGFRAATRPDIAGLDAERLPAVLGDEFQYAVIGRVNAEFLSPQGSRHLYQAVGELTVVHLGTGEVADTLSDTFKLLRDDRTDAAASAAARELVRRKLLPLLDERFVADFAR